MSKRSRRRDDDLARGIIALLFIGGSSVLTFWRSLPPESQTFLTIAGVVMILSGFGSLILFAVYRKHRRAAAWQRAMSAWDRSIKAGYFPEGHTARRLTAQELEKFAAQVYRQMGYRVQHSGRSGDHGVDVRMVNPKGEVEIAQCKQWNKPVGEPEVRNLAGSMLNEKAVRAFLWAPGGFSENARRWAKGKAIVLADDQEIGRLVESAYGQNGANR